MEALRILLCKWVTFPLLRQHMEQHRLVLLSGPSEHLRQLLHIVAVHGTHIGKSHFLKHGALRQQSTLEPVLHLRAGLIQIFLGGRVALQLFLVPFLEIVIPFLRAKPGKVSAEATHIGLNRHPVVVENDDYRLTGSAGIIQSLKAQSTGHGSVTDQSQNTVILVEQSSGVGHTQCN